MINKTMTNKMKIKKIIIINKIPKKLKNKQNKNEIIKI